MSKKNIRKIVNSRLSFLYEYGMQDDFLHTISYLKALKSKVSSKEDKEYIMLVIRQLEHDLKNKLDIFE